MASLRAAPFSEDGESFWEEARALTLESAWEPSPTHSHLSLLVPEFCTFSLCLPPFHLQTLPTKPSLPSSRISFSFFPCKHTVMPRPWPLTYPALMSISVPCSLSPSLLWPASGSCRHILTLASSIFPHSSQSLCLCLFLPATYIQLWGQVFGEFESLFKPPQLREAGCNLLVIEMIKGLENLSMCVCVCKCVCVYIFISWRQNNCPQP